MSHLPDPQSPSSAVVAHPAAANGPLSRRDPVAGG